MIESNPKTLRICLRDPIPEIAQAARYLAEAVSAHLVGRSDLVEELIRRADIPAIREWTESLWGKNSPHVRFRSIPNAPPTISREQRIRLRMPTTAEKKILLQRDGYHCRFCGIPVIRETVRRRIKAVYPNALSWGGTNATQHAAFQAMWVQYDHLLPHARGGDNSLDNMVITCAPCNFGRMNYCLEEVDLIDPRTREPVRSSWDGLERFR
jgi:5-methylcytosine-specific restriction endonuclease McrA